MILLALSATEWIAIIGALCTGIAGILAAWGSVVAARKKAKEEADGECAKKLQAVRIESEKYAEELHQLRLKALE